MGQYVYEFKRIHFEKERKLEPHAFKHLWSCEEILLSNWLCDLQCWLVMCLEDFVVSSISNFLYLSVAGFWFVLVRLWRSKYSRHVYLYVVEIRSRVSLFVSVFNIYAITPHHVFVPFIGNIICALLDDKLDTFKTNEYTVMMIHKKPCV
jgi:ABC-type amino acid transport system permease subunit